MHLLFKSQKYTLFKLVRKLKSLNPKVSAHWKIEMDYSPYFINTEYALI
jgi:hypothetical protein